METLKQSSPRISRHKIRLVGVAGVVAGLCIIIFGGTSTLQTLDALSGSLTHAEKLQFRALKEAEKATNKVDARLQQVEERAQREFESAQTKMQKELEKAEKIAMEEKEKIQETLKKKIKDTADLTIVKEGPERISSQDDLVYRVTLTNAGPMNVNQIRFSEPRHDQLTLEAAAVIDSDDDVSCSNIEDRWVCVLEMTSPLSAKQSKVIELRYRTHAVDQDPPCDTTFVTGPTMIHSGDTTPIDLYKDNNESTSISTYMMCSGS